MKRVSLTLIVIFITTLIVPVQADVVIKQKSNMDMGGIVKMEVDATEYIKGDKGCTSSIIEVGGGMMAMMGQSSTMETDEITRLDKKLMWTVDHSEKTYSETNLAVFKDMMGESGGMEGMPESEDNPDDYEWTVDVSASDKKTDINGFKCKNVIAKATGVKKDDPDYKMYLNYEYWYTSDVDGYDEIKAYHDQFDDITGVDMAENRQDAGMIFEKYGDQFDEMTEKMGETEGYPIKIVITVESEGGESAGMSGMPSGMMDMMGMMGKKGKSESKGGKTTVFSITTEVQSIEKKAVDDSKFEIPEGYDKQ